MTPEQARAWRERLGLTREQAARALGISASHLQNYELGRNRSSGAPAPIPPSIEKAMGWIELFGPERGYSGAPLDKRTIAELA